MKKTLGLLLATLLFSPFASANCKIPQINGLWEGVSFDNSGVVAACALAIKGSGLLDGSGCSDSLEGSGDLENASVTLDKENCTLEVEFEYLGVDYAYVLTIDRKRVVATGFVLDSNGNVGTVTLVKKA